MAYNLASIRDKVLNDKLDDTTYDPAIIDDFINDAQRSIFNTYELPFQEAEDDDTIASGDFEIDFPDDYQREQALIIVGPNNSIRDITRNYLPWRKFINSYPLPSNNTPGAPMMWTVHAGRVLLSRPADQNYQYVLWYIKSPAELSDDADVPEIPESFQEILVLGAYYRVLERNEDFDLAAFYKTGEYAEELDKMVARLMPTQVGTPTVMSQPQQRNPRRRTRS